MAAARARRQVLVGQVEDLPVVGVGVNGGHCPLTMPKESCSTFATGARQLVVQEALETMWWVFGVRLVVVYPQDDREVLPLAGAEMMTCLAPAVDACLRRRRSVKRPVTMTPWPRSPPAAAAHGGDDGARAEHDAVDVDVEDPRRRPRRSTAVTSDSPRAIPALRNARSRPPSCVLGRGHDRVASPSGAGRRPPRAARRGRPAAPACRPPAPARRAPAAAREVARPIPEAPPVTHRSSKDGMRADRASSRPEDAYPFAAGHAPVATLIEVMPGPRPREPALRRALRRHRPGHRQYAAGRAAPAVAEAVRSHLGQAGVAQPDGLDQGPRARAA